MGTLPFDFAAEDFPLAPVTFYQVGGPARLVLLPRTFEEAIAAYDWMSGQPGPKLVLGGGSNVLVSDRGFDGIVLITTHLDEIKPLGASLTPALSQGERESMTLSPRERAGVRVACGVALDTVVRTVMVPNNYEGVGGLAGIPGSVGGALYMNAGTVNGTACQLVESVEVLTPEGRRTVRLDASMYDYRWQSFCPRGGLILRAVFRFNPAQEDQQAVFDHYIERRQAKQPQGCCCGSIFKNPPGDHAGRLIEACGLKGTRRGGAVISPLHANFIMNEEGATFDDIVGLIELCKQSVHARFGVELHEEVVIVKDSGF